MKSFVIALIAIISLISGCACDPVLVPTVVPVTVLPMPELPKLTQAQENEIADETYEVLVRRDQTLLEHIETINGLIKIHNTRDK